MAYTVPPVPDDLHPAGCWRRQLKSLNWQARGGFRAVGVHLNPGDTVELPEGALVLRVDKATRGWEENYRTFGRHAVEDATVTAYLAAGGELTEVWSRQYMNAKNAFGAFTMKKLAALMEKHPVPEGEPVVLHEVRRPTLKDGACRWCSGRIARGAPEGHRVGHGEEAQVEHYQQCPPNAVPVTTGEVCARCGVTVLGRQAHRVPRRDGSGETQVVHRQDCRQAPPAPAEELLAREAERAAERAAAREAEKKKEAKREADRARREAKKKQAEARKKAEWEAEQERIASLSTVARESVTLFDKGLGGPLRVCLQEHLDTLSDGTTTTRWSVRTYTSGAPVFSEVEPDDPGPETCEMFTVKSEARACYRTYQWSPARYPRREAASGRPCDECDGRGATVQRYDSSGIAGWVCSPCDRLNPDDYMLSFG